MRKIQLLTVMMFSLCAVMGSVHAADDNLNQKKLLAQAFFEVRPVGEAADAAIAQIAATKPEAERAIFIKKMRANMDYAHLESEMTTALVNTYSADEIKAMTAFYGSPLGKSIMEKQGDFQTAVSNILASMLDQAFMKATYGNKGLQSRP